MNITHRLTLTALVLGLAATLSAQPPGGRGPRGGGPGGPGGPGRGPSAGIVRAIDTDKDGTLSATELAGASAAIAKLDTNGDGALTAADRPARPEGEKGPKAEGKNGKGPRPDGAAKGGRGPGGPGGRGGRGGPVDPVMLALDADNNHELSSTEIANASASLAAIDSNKDGSLTKDELRPLPPADAKDGKPGRGGRGGPRGRE